MSNIDNANRLYNHIKQHRNVDGFVGGSSSTEVDWDSLEGKPFESIGAGLSVDSEGVISTEGVNVVEILLPSISSGNYPITQEIYDSVKPGTIILVKYDSVTYAYVCLSDENENGEKWAITIDAQFKNGEHFGYSQYWPIYVASSSHSTNPLTIYWYGLRPAYSFRASIPSGDGDYIPVINVNNHTYTDKYVEYNIPAPPTSDGTYTLQCTVTNGVPTYSWV